jgi:DNA gyrase subunit A
MPKKPVSPPPAEPSGEEIVDTNVAAELKNSFLEYSMSVIVSRALPDVRDGLKPVQRRILYSMHEAGMLPSKGYHKCARVVGAVMGALHPHGDSAIYEALVRIAQPFSLRLPLVDGHGNFGSLDDGPAASRYTECRLDNAAVALVGELDEDTVDFKPNYDGRETEPTVLPGAFPNLLVNGTTGIAVGMATNMAPHNLVEVVAGMKAMLADPKITDDELMTFIPGPDLPTGGLVIGVDGIREAYRTGRGQFRIRARAEITDVSARRRGIVITELPFNIGPEKVIARIKELIGDKKLQGVSDVKDYSDRKVGLRLVIECKTGFNPSAVLDELYRLTPLEEGFSINNVALVDNQPQTLSLRQLCHHYLTHRLEVTRRRTEHRRRRAAARAHIVEGLLAALGDIDRVVALIKASKDSAAARGKLCKEFALSELQAEAILEMTLRRLTSLEVGKLRDELKELKATIKMLEALLASDRKLRELVATELDAVASALGTPRRSTILETAPTSHDASLEIPDDPCVVTLSPNGTIARHEGTLAGKATKGDLVVSEIESTGRSQFAVITSLGRMFRLGVVELPAKPTKVTDLLDLGKGESAVAVVSLQHPVAIGTRLGLVKRVDISSLPTRSNVFTVIGLKADDVVVGAVTAQDASEIVFVTSDAQLLRFGSDAVRPQGASAGGMTGVRLAQDATVVYFNALADRDDAVVATMSNAGSVKVSPLAEYPAKGRGTGGVRCHAFRKGESALSAAAVGQRVVALSTTGAAAALPDRAARRDASGTVPAEPVHGFAHTRR